jgi:hypothetical protein
MDVEDLITEHTVSGAVNTSNLSPGVMEAVNRSDRNADVSFFWTGTNNSTSELQLTQAQDRFARLVALMPARPNIDRALEIQRQATGLKQESIDNAQECQYQYIWWLTYNRRYLRLKAQLENVAKPLVLDPRDATHLQQITELLILDTERAKAQAALTRLTRRELKIFEEFKQGYLEWVEIMGVVVDEGFLERLAQRVRRQYEITRKLGQRLVGHALGTAHNHA